MLSLSSPLRVLQIRLTPEEYAHVTLAKRKMEAESKYRARIASAKERQQALKDQASGGQYGRGAAGGAASGGSSSAAAGGGVGGMGATGEDFAYQHASVLRSEEYQDPMPKNSYFYRSP